MPTFHPVVIATCARRLAAALLLCLYALSSAYASPRLLWVGGAGLPALHSSSGQPLADGYSVCVGTLSEGFDPADAGDVNALADSWITLEDVTTRTESGYPGSFAGSSDCAAFSGKAIYLLVRRTRDGSLDADDWSNVVEYGLYGSSQESWTFPSVGIPPPGNTRMVDSREINQAWHGSLKEGVILLEPNLLASDAQRAFAQWQDSAFSQAVAANARAAQEDPDGDGLVNLMEFAMSLCPNSCDSPAKSLRKQSSIPRGTFGEGAPALSEELVYTFTRRTDVPGLLLRAEVSYDLQHWDAGVTEIIIESNGATQTIEARAVMKPTGTFFRLRSDLN